MKRRALLAAAGCVLWSSRSLAAPSAWLNPEALGGAQPPAWASVPRGDLIGAAEWLVTDGSASLMEVAQQRSLGILEVLAANPGVDPWVPGDGRAVLLPSAHLLPEAPRRGVVVNVAELRLYLFHDDGTVETHPIGVGREGHSTPMGETTVVRKTEKPSWRPTAATRADNPELPAVVGPGPDNPLGEHALYLGWPTYLIHGTNAPFGVGRQASRGCIRMYPRAVARLYEIVPVGTPVRVVDQAVKVGVSEGRVLLEVHPDKVQLDELEAHHRWRTPRALNEDVWSKRLASLAAPLGRSIDEGLVRRTLRARAGVPVAVDVAGGDDGWDVRDGFGGLY